MSKTTNATSSPATTVGELRLVPIDRVRIVEGFNHRQGPRDADRVALTVASIRARGVLEPLLVMPADADGIYDLVDGEKRLRSAAEAGLSEVPCYVRDHGDLKQRRLDALLANITQDGVDLVEEARAYAGMRAERMSIRAIAQLLSPTITVARVRERLRLLELPEPVLQHVVDGTIPLLAVRALADVAAVDGALCETLVSHVHRGLTHKDPWRRQQAWSWKDVARRTDDVLNGIPDDELPQHVFALRTPYPLERFQLDKDAESVLAELVPDEAERPRAGIQFTEPDLEQARAMRATCGRLIVGVDAASALLAGLLGRVRDERRAAAERGAAQDRAVAAAHADSAEPAGSQDDALVRALCKLEGELMTRPAGELEQLLERFAGKHGSVPRRLELLAARRLAQAAHAYNAELGIAVVKAFARVRVDERTIKIVSAFDVHGDLDAIASRGARYCMPGWFTVETMRGGREKVRYLDHGEPRERAREFLAGATKASELLGRQLTLLILARLADQRAVARSSRHGGDPGVLGWISSYAGEQGGCGHGLPWAPEVNTLLLEMAIELLPEHLVADARAAHEQREAKRAEREAAEAAHRAAEQAFAAELRSMDPKDIPAAVDAFFEEHSMLDVDIQKLARALADAGEQNPSSDEEPDAAAAAESEVREPVAA